MGPTSNKIFALAFISCLAGAAFTAPAAVKPVEYVKICSLYGDGFYYIPGTDTCIRMGGYVQAGVGFGRSFFDLVPDFNFSSDGWEAGVGGQALAYTPNGFVMGIEGGYTRSDLNGSAIWAGNGLEHSWKLRSFFDVKGIVGVQLPKTAATPNVAPPSLSLVVGETWGEARLGGGAFVDNRSVSGFTIGGLWDQPMSPHCSFGVEVTYTRFGRDTYNLGGPVTVDQNVWSAVFRLQRNFSVQ